jgi:hypothetical protein
VSDSGWPPTVSEKRLEEKKQAMKEKVEGEVKYGQPVEIHIQRDNREKKILTYFGWFRDNGRAFPGEMEVCQKRPSEEADEDFVLSDMQHSPINPEDVEKIVPLEHGGESPE